MTKDKAIALIKEGKKITHKSFMANEYITIKNSRLEDEDGNILDSDLFWNMRIGDNWKDGYSIWEDQLQLKTK